MITEDDYKSEISKYSKYAVSSIKDYNIDEEAFSSQFDEASNFMSLCERDLADARAILEYTEALTYVSLRSGEKKSEAFIQNLVTLNEDVQKLRKDKRECEIRSGRMKGILMALREKSEFLKRHGFVIKNDYFEELINRKDN